MNQALSGEKEAYRMIQQLRGGVSVVGSSFDPSGGGLGRCVAEHGGGGLRLSALHPKVLCELLDFEKILSVDCGTGSGQRAQHVRHADYGLQ